VSEIIKTVKLTDHSVVSTCLPASGLHGTDVSGVRAGGDVRLGGNERPTKAPAAVAAQAYASVFVAANGAGEGSQKTQHTMWAFRGHDPWRDPA
jgi:hypothetical protein